MDDLQKAMVGRINRRKQAIVEHCNRVIREIEKGKHGGEEGRTWLEQFCEGEGLNFCAGAFQLADSIGVDMNPRELGMDLWAYGDRFFATLGPVDYIVTNYLECFPDTLRVLTEWRQLMKPEATLAIVARDAEMYGGGVGPLSNPHRVAVFSQSVLRCYLERAGFTPLRWESFQKEIRVAARRR
jgi:hypothetical protein